MESENRAARSDRWPKTSLMFAFYRSLTRESGWSLLADGGAGRLAQEPAALGGGSK